MGSVESTLSLDPLENLQNVGTFWLCFGYVYNKFMEIIGLEGYAFRKSVYVFGRVSVSVDSFLVLVLFFWGGRQA